MLTISEISNIIQADKGSERKNHAKTGRDYYEAKHDIRNYRIFYFNSDGSLVEDKTRANFRIPHPFFTELVDQCVQYMLSGDKFAFSDDTKLQEHLDKYFDDDFISELSDTLVDVCSCGFGYMYAYMSDDRTKFMYADGIGVCEVMAKDTDDNCDYVVYWYTDRIDKGNKKILRIQVWSKTDVTYYCEVNDGEIVLDKSRKLNPRPHIVKKDTETEDRFGSGFGYIPFFRIDANRKQINHLKPIKSLIDDYDLIACGLTNNIQDVADAVYVVKGFEGNNLDELQKNIKTKKMIGVTDDGGVDIITTQIPTEARKVKLDLDEKNIYRFGMGFNSAQIGDGNITNIVIKSRYALLDMKCNKLEKKLKAFIKNILGVVLDEINQNNGTEYSLSDVKIEFTREVMTNALDNAQIEYTKAQTKQLEVNTLLNAAAQLGEESVLESLCELLDLNLSDVKKVLEDNSDETHNALQMLSAVGDKVE